MTSQHVTDPAPCAANRHDLMDDYVMERIRFRLLKLKEFEEKSTTRRRHIPKLSSNTSEVGILQIPTRS